MNDRLSVTRLKLLARQAVTGALDLLFPPHCVNCSRVGSFLCDRCKATMTLAPERTLPGLDGIRVKVNFEGAASAAIHAFKYDGQTRLVEPLGEILYQGLEGIDWQVDMVTAVPLHAARLRERGYNQAALLAGYLAVLTGWPSALGAVTRVRETSSQVHLSARERQENVAGAFRGVPELVHGKRVLVIDDVLTTGATLVACAEALRAAGAARVYGATVAGAVFRAKDAGVPDASV